MKIAHLCILTTCPKKKEAISEEFIECGRASEAAKAPIINCPKGNDDFDDDNIA